MIASLLVAVVLFNGCKKKGCTDADASNYDSGAKSDDGSCDYKAGVSIWVSQATSTTWVGDGASTVKFYVNGSLIGSAATSVYYASSPGCSSGSAHQMYDLGNNKTKPFTYSYVLDYPTGASAGGDTTVTVAGSGTLSASNSCLSIQL